MNDMQALAIRCGGILPLVFFAATTIGQTTEASKYVDDFANGCDPSDSALKLNAANFAPLVKPPGGRWPVPAKPLKAQYSNGTYTIQPKGQGDTNAKNEIVFFSSLRNVESKSPDYPTHYWHVISVTRIPEKPEPGEAKREVEDAQMIDWKKAATHYKAKLEEDGLNLENLVGESGRDKRIFLYNTIVDEIPTTRSKVTRAWNVLLDGKNSKVMEKFVDTGLKLRKEGKVPVPYYHAFYYVPMPRGKFWVSTREISDEGLAYGFVLDDKGDCISASKLKIVR